MAEYVRKNAWNGGGTLTGNPDLYWYAKGVGAMMSRPLNDKNSWWFYAAIHGINFEKWAAIQAPPGVPTSPVPDPNTQQRFWRQCQHGTWYFLPWHRGYLIALEKQIRMAVIQQGGPASWALPYWNYFGGGDEYRIPPAFMLRSYFDKEEGREKANPLFVAMRYGPDNNGNVYMPIGETGREVNQNCQKMRQFIGNYTNAYGGDETEFSHNGYALRGALEDNPHNFGHTNIGGSNPLGQSGLMSDPQTAGLDPIFYLHHGQIDRMWAGWNLAGNTNPSQKAWLEGPPFYRQRPFIMPLPSGDWVYTPGELDSLAKCDYTYEVIEPVKSLDVAALLSTRLSKIGVQHDLPDLKALESMKKDASSDLVGANDRPLSLKDSAASATVQLDGSGWKKVGNSFEKASAQKAPDHIFLYLENVTGTHDGNFLHVSVNGVRVGSASLFGLHLASQKDEHHAGTGLTLLFDITDLVDDLFLSGDLEGQEQLDVKIETEHGVPGAEEINVGRIAVYRESQ